MYRSRLQSLEEKKNIRKAVYILAGSILLVIMIFVVGVPLLVRIVGNGGKSSGDKNDLIPPIAPTITLSYDATNSARQTVSGLAEPESTVYLTQNLESKGNVKTGSDGVFRFENVVLKEGENKFAAVAADQSGNKSQPSQEISLYYSTKSPELKIDSPTDGQQISGNPAVVEVKGSTSAYRLKVNDRLIILNSSGVFSTTYVLNGGENILVFVATDKSGNQTRKELTVIATP